MTWPWGAVLSMAAASKAYLGPAVCRFGAATAMTRLSLRLDVHDTHNGLACFTGAAAAKICITQNRMGHAGQILKQISAHRLRFCEVPVTVHYTAYSLAKGQSSLNAFNIVWDSCLDLLGISLIQLTLLSGMLGSLVFYFVRPRSRLSDRFIAAALFALGGIAVIMPGSTAGRAHARRGKRHRSCSLSGCSYRRLDGRSDVCANHAA